MGLRYRPPRGLRGLLADWDGEHAVVRFDPESGAWIFVCVHSTARGPAGGGTRMRVYPTPADGLRRRDAPLGSDDAEDGGGGRCRAAAARRARGAGAAHRRAAQAAAAALRRARRLARRQLPHGRRHEHLAGRISTSSPRRARGSTGRRGGGGNSGRGTARGALHAIRATVEHRLRLAGARRPQRRSCRAPAPSARSSRASSPTPARAFSSATSTRRGPPPPASRPSHPSACSRRRWTSTRRAPSAAPSTPSRSPPRLPRGRRVREQPARRAGGRGAPDTSAASSTRRTTSSTPGGIIQLIGLEDEGWDEAQLEERLAGIGDTLRDAVRRGGRGRHHAGGGGRPARRAAPRRGA